MDENRHTLPARAPSQYKYGNDFTTYYRVFVNYCDTLNIEPEDRFKILLTFVDTRTFETLNNLNLGEVINIQEHYETILRALQTEREEIPPRYLLKHRKQKADESIAEYAYKLEILANRAYQDVDMKNQQLLDVFCSGLIDSDLSVKLLQEQHQHFAEAVEFAKKVHQAISIRRFVVDSKIKIADTSAVQILANSSSHTVAEKPHYHHLAHDSQSLTEKDGGYCYCYTLRDHLDNRSGSRTGVAAAVKTNNDCTCCNQCKNKQTTPPQQTQTRHNLATAAVQPTQWQTPQSQGYQQQQMYSQQGFQPQHPTQFLQMPQQTQYQQIPQSQRYNRGTPQQYTPRNQTQRPRHITPDQQGDYYRNFTCYGCGQTGHIRRDCKNSRQFFQKGPYTQSGPRRQH